MELSIITLLDVSSPLFRTHPLFPDFLQVFNQLAESKQLPFSIYGDWILYWFANQDKYQKVTIQDRYALGEEEPIYSDCAVVVLSKTEEGFLFVRDDQPSIHFPCDDYLKIKEQYKQIRLNEDPWCTEKGYNTELDQETGPLRVFLNKYFTQLGIEGDLHIDYEKGTHDSNHVCEEASFSVLFYPKKDAEIRLYLNQLIREITSTSSLPKSWFTVDGNETMVFVQKITDLQLLERDIIYIQFQISWCYKWVYDLFIYPSVLELELTDSKDVRKYVTSPTWINDVTMEKLEAIIKERF